jgi:hypothetical protein
MDEKRFTVPDYKDWEYPLEQAYTIVRDKLLKTEDIPQQCRNSGCEYRRENGKEIVTVKYLGSLYDVVLPDIEIRPAGPADALPLREQVLVLHYMTSAKGTPPSGKLITFRELPEGVVYFPTFSKRTIKPLMDNFGHQPSKLFEVSKAFDGVPADYGDTAVTINAFSRVPLTIVLWHGDEEFTPEGSIVFNANITDYLSTEDITVISELITWKLVRRLRAG